MPCTTSYGAHTFLTLPPSAISSFTNLSASAPKPPDDSTAKATQVAPILSASRSWTVPCLASLCDVHAVPPLLELPLRDSREFWSKLSGRSTGPNQAQSTNQAF